MSGPTGPPTIQWLILNDYNFAPTEDTLYEEFDLGGAETVQKFNNAQLSMNCKFKFDTDLWEP